MLARVGMSEAQYVLARPHPALAGCVLGYSGYREHSAAPLRRRQAPTGACTLIVGFRGPDPAPRARGADGSGGVYGGDARHGGDY